MVTVQPLTYADGRYTIKGLVAGTYEVQKYEPISQLLIRHTLRDQGPESMSRFKEMLSTTSLDGYRLRTSYENDVDSRVGLPIACTFNFRETLQYKPDAQASESLVT